MRSHMKKAEIKIMLQGSFLISIFVPSVLVSLDESLATQTVSDNISCKKFDPTMITINDRAKTDKRVGRFTES